MTPTIALDEVHALESDESVAQRCDERRAVDHASAHDADDEELVGEEVLYPLDVACHERVEVLVLGKLCFAR